MKRMIDNKEFDALVKDVNDLKQEAPEIAKSKDKGIYFTLEEPTENTGVYTYALTTIGNINTDIPLKVGDLIMSFDSTDLENVKSSNMWRIDEIGEDSVEVVLVGKVGGSGKKQYQHNITISNKNNSAWIFRLTILNDSITTIGTTALRLWLTAKGFDINSDSTKYYKAEGNYSVGASACDVIGIANNSGGGNDIWLQGISKDGTTKQTGALGGQYNIVDDAFEI